MIKSPPYSLNSATEISEVMIAKRENFRIEIRKNRLNDLF
jgi:hypothetical protein